MSNFFYEAEIAQLNSSLFLDEHVLWLNVPMEEAVAVDVVEGGGDLHYNVPDLLVRKRIVVQLPHLHHSVQVHVEQLEDHVQSIFMADDLEAGDNIRVL